LPFVQRTTSHILQPYILYLGRILLAFGALFREISSPNVRRFRILIAVQL
jgi:hypothetical protein